MAPEPTSVLLCLAPCGTRRPGHLLVWHSTHLPGRLQGQAQGAEEEPVWEWQLLLVGLQVLLQRYNQRGDTGGTLGVAVGLGEGRFCASLECLQQLILGPWQDTAWGTRGCCPAPTALSGCIPVGWFLPSRLHRVLACAADRSLPVPSELWATRSRLQLGGVRQRLVGGLRGALPLPPWLPAAGGPCQRLPVQRPLDPQAHLPP